MSMGSIWNLIWQPHCGTIEPGEYLDGAEWLLLRCYWLGGAFGGGGWTMTEDAFLKATLGICKQRAEGINYRPAPASKAEASFLLGGLVP
jgi:hypothetical protein